MFATGNPQSKIPAIRVVIDKASQLHVKIDFEATIKPLVMMLRQRSPNFNDLASQYLKDRNPQLLADWEDHCLDHLDSLLSEIDYVVDQFGMQTSLRDLTDDRSTANEVTAISAFAIYADSTDNSDASTGGQPKQSGQNQGNRWKCKVKDCDKFIGKKFQAECTERKKKLVAEGKWNNSMQKVNVCYNCHNRLKQGEVSSLKLKNGKDYTLPEKQSDGRANNVNTDDTASDDKVSAAGAQDDDMTSKILDVLGKVFVSGTADTTAAPS